MRPRHGSRFAPAVFMLAALVLAVVLSACNLTSSVPSQATLDVTQAATSTAGATLTAGLPTRTPQGTLAGQITSRPPTFPTVVVGFPTAALPPTNVVVVPTIIPLPQVPVSIAILSPVPGQIIAGSTVQVLGSASHPQFLQYQLEFGPDPNPNNLWYLVTNPVTTPVQNALLGLWNTVGLSDATYQLRLRVYLRDGTSQATVTGGIRVQNAAATPVPSATPSTPRPIAAFSSSVTSGQVPLTVNFANQSFGQVTSYNWNFGNGASSSEANPSFTYNAPGLYTVTLTVIGPGGSSNVSSQINVLSPSAPVASFNAAPASGTAPLTVQFTDASTGQISTFFWNFSDGTTSTERNPVKTFNAAGTFNVFLTVTGPGGSAFFSRPITVSAPPTAIPPTTVPPTNVPPSAVPPTNAPTATDLPTSTATATDQPTATATEPPTLTPTDLPSATPTETPSITPSPTVGITISDTQPPLPSFGDPNLNAGLRGTFDSGVGQGRQPNIFTVAGDQLFASGSVLTPFGTGSFNLDANGQLQPVITFYSADPNGTGAASFNRPSPGVLGGGTASALLDPNNANPGICQPGETPIACAARANAATVLLISTGANDAVQGTDPAQFTQSLQQIIDTARAAGAIPVLVTVPPRLDGAAPAVKAINDAIINTANANQVPVVNLYAALNALPNSGLSGDGVSLSVAGSGPGDLSPGAVSQGGANTINLLLLQTLSGLQGGVFPETIVPTP